MEITAQSIYRKVLQSQLLNETDSAFIFYSRSLLSKRLAVLQQSFNNSDVLHTVAIKTNPHPEILRCIVKHGLGLEAASFEEVILAVNIGLEFGKIVYNSPVKTHHELRYCAEHFPGIRINANSINELGRLPRNVRLGLRINPLVEASTESIYNVSMADSKFGVPISEEEDILQAVIDFKISTLHIHVGSRVESPEVLLEALQKTVDLCDEINHQLQRSAMQFEVTEINFGGGISSLENIKDSDELMQKYATGVIRIINKADFQYRLIDEFGQWVHQHNGFAYSRVEYVRSVSGKNVAFLHLGADFFPREIYSPINTLKFEFFSKQGDSKSAMLTQTDLAGPLCFNGDYLAKGIEAPVLDVGDIVAIPSIGANTFGLWSRHCSRTIPVFISENLNSNDGYEILSKRENPFVNLVNYHQV